MAIALVQNKGGEATQANMAVTLTSGPTQNNLLVAVFRTNLALSAVTIPSGWTTRSSQDGSGQCAIICDKVAGAGESSTVTFTHTSASAALEVYEFSGTATSSEFDAQNSHTTGGATTTSEQAGTVTPAATGEVFVCGASTSGANGGSEAIGSSFTITDAATFARLVTGYKIKTDANAENPAMSWLTLRTACSVLAAFKPSAATVTGTASATLGGLTATAVATPTVVATANAPLGGLTATAVATPTVLATAAAPLGGLTATAIATVTSAQTTPAGGNLVKPRLHLGNAPGPRQQTGQGTLAYRLTLTGLGELEQTGTLAALLFDGTGQIEHAEQHTWTRTTATDACLRGTGRLELATGREGVGTCTEDADDILVLLSI